MTASVSGLSSPPGSGILRAVTGADASIHAVRRKEHLFGATLTELRRTTFAPTDTKRFERRWPIGKAAGLVGMTRQTIRQREAAGALPEPVRTEAGRHIGYTLPELNHMRDAFGTRPGRAPTDEPAVLAFTSFKGGAGKSTLSVHFSQYMALRGYRVLVIDCDPQGTASTLFGMRLALEPDDDTDAPPTLERFLARAQPDFLPCVRTSYFPGVDLVPSDLSLFDIEYRMAADMRGTPGMLNDLRDGIRSVWQDYDIVVLDPPPALGLLSLSVLNAANALVIPMRPTLVDFASTYKFLSMLRNNLETMHAAGYDVDYHFSALAVNGMDDHKSAHTEITAAMRQMFIGEDLLDTMMRDSAEIDNAGKEMRTVYDLAAPMVSRKTYMRCITYLDRMNGELERRVRQTWPSQRARLRDEAQL